MQASGSIKRTATSDKPGKGSFVPKNREIPKDLSEEQAKPVLHIKPKRESTIKVFSETDWKNICSTLFSAMMLREDAHQYGDVMINGPKLDKKGQGFILCKDQNGLNWLLNLAKESLKSAECYQGNYAPRANLRVKFLGMHEGDPVTLLKTSLKMSGISSRYPDEIKIRKVTPISASGRVVDFNLNKKDMEEIGTYRELQKKNTLLLFTQIPFHILLPDGKEDNWEPKGNNNKAQAPSAKSQEKETPIIDLVNENSGIETKSPSREPVTNSEPKFGTNQDESTSMTFSEREFNENKSLRPKIPTEPPKDQNGPGNSQKTSLNIPSDTTKSKDSNVTDDNIYTKNNEKSPRLTINSGNGNETPKIRKSARIGRGQKGCNKTCAGCSSHEHKTPSNNTLKKDRKPSRRPPERYVKHSFLKILNSVIQSPKTDNISVSYGSDNKVQIKRKFEMSVEPAKNEASNEASKVDPENDKKTSSTFKDKSPGQSKKLSNKSKKIKQNPKAP